MTYHVFLSARRHVILTDLQLKYISFPVECKAPKELDNPTLVSDKKQLRNQQDKVEGQISVDSALQDKKA